MKKFIYGFLLFFIVLIIAVVVAANSSWVIKKAADKFAPEYKISYDDITGNLFTGLKVSGLKYDGNVIDDNIELSWRPFLLLEKRVVIKEIIIDGLHVDVLKALVDSFPKSEEDGDEPSSPLPVTITVNKVRASVKPFVEQGIGIEKVLLNIDDVTYANDEISVGKLFMSADSNVTDIVLYASLYDGKLVVDELGVENIDSETLQNMFMPADDSSTYAKTTQNENTSDKDKTEKTEEMNPLIPKKVFVKRFLATLKPRIYKTAAIDKIEVSLQDVNADLVKVLSNEKGAIDVGQAKVNFQSDVAQLDLLAGLKNSVVTVDHLNINSVDTLALQALFISDNNESNSSENNTTVVQADKKSEEEKANKDEDGKEKEKNNLIPEKVVIKEIHTDILPSEYDPVLIQSFALDANDIEVNVPKLLVEDGNISFVGKTNLSDFRHESRIKNNILMGDIVITPNKELYTKYSLPLRSEAIKNLKIDLNASEEKVMVLLSLKAKALLATAVDSNNSDANVSDVNGSQPFNVDIDDLTSNAVYIVKDNILNADTKILLSTPYAKNISITNNFVMDKNISYSGAINAEKVIGLDAKMVKPLQNFQVLYTGDLHSVDTNISADGLKGSFVSPDFKKGHFHLETSSKIAVAQLVKLPSELNATEVGAIIDVPLDFTRLTTVKGTAKISSNVANIDAVIMYGKVLQAKITTTIPKDSLLTNFDKNIHFAAISPLVTNVNINDKTIKVTAKSSKVAADVDISPYAKKLNGKLKVAGLSATINTQPNEDIVIKSDVGSFTALFNTINQFYTVENMPKVDGKLSAHVVIKKNKDATLNLSSPQVIYHADRRTEHVLDDVKIALGTKGSQLMLKSYQLTYNKMKLYSTKPSMAKFHKEMLKIVQIWLNDQLKVTGDLDTKKMKGTILADATKFHLAHEMIDLDSEIHIKTAMDGNKTNVTGKITLLNGDIHYDLATKTFPSDSDIVVVQEMKKDEPNPFMDNLTIAVNVDTKKPLVFKQGPIDVKANVDLGIHKSIYSDPMIIGSVDLVNGGSYLFQGKRFVLENSHVYFTGDPEKPMLDITVKYKTLKSSIITINITGTPQVPNVLFSSVPSKTKEEILSIILFDSEDGAGTNSGDDMMKMMGGAMAKSALSNLGIQLDHLVFGEGNSVEVGKKISDKVTVIYINGDIPEMKVKYDYSPTLNAVVGASERSESVDVVYTKDFSMGDDDIVVKGR